MVSSSNDKKKKSGRLKKKNWHFDSRGFLYTSHIQDKEASKWRLKRKKRVVENLISNYDRRRLTGILCHGRRSNGHQLLSTRKSGFRGIKNSKLSFILKHLSAINLEILLKWGSSCMLSFEDTFFWSSIQIHSLIPHPKRRLSSCLVSPKKGAKARTRVPFCASMRLSWMCFELAPSLA